MTHQHKRTKKKADQRQRDQKQQETPPKTQKVTPILALGIEKNPFKINFIDQRRPNRTFSDFDYFEVERNGYARIIAKKSIFRHGHQPSSVSLPDREQGPLAIISTFPRWYGLSVIAFHGLAKPGEGTK